MVFGTVDPHRTLYSNRIIIQLSYQSPSYAINTSYHCITPLNVIIKHYHHYQIPQNYHHILLTPIKYPKNNMTSKKPLISSSHPKKPLSAHLQVLGIAACREGISHTCLTGWGMTSGGRDLESKVVPYCPYCQLCLLIYKPNVSYRIMHSKIM